MRKLKITLIALLLIISASLVNPTMAVPSDYPPDEYTVSVMIYGGYRVSRTFYGGSARTWAEFDEEITCWINYVCYNR